MSALEHGSVSALFASVRATLKARTKDRSRREPFCEFLRIDPGWDAKELNGHRISSRVFDDEVDRGCPEWLRDDPDREEFACVESLTSTALDDLRDRGD